MFLTLSKPRSILPNTFLLFALLFEMGFSGVANTQSSFLTLRFLGVLSRPLSTDRLGDIGLFPPSTLKMLESIFSHNRHQLEKIFQSNKSENQQL